MAPQHTTKQLERAARADKTTRVCALGGAEDEDAHLKSESFVSSTILT
jgi:hypothetical protein